MFYGADGECRETGLQNCQTVFESGLYFDCYNKQTKYSYYLGDALPTDFATAPEDPEKPSCNKTFELTKCDDGYVLCEKKWVVQDNFWIDKWVSQSDCLTVKLLPKNEGVVVDSRCICDPLEQQHNCGSSSNDSEVSCTTGEANWDVFLDKFYPALKYLSDNVVIPYRSGAIAAIGCGRSSVGTECRDDLVPSLLEFLKVVSKQIPPEIAKPTGTVQKKSEPIDDDFEPVDNDEPDYDPYGYR